MENVKWQNTHWRRHKGRGRESVERAIHLNLQFTVDSDAVFSVRLASRPPVLPALQFITSFEKHLTGYHTALPSSLKKNRSSAGSSAPLTLSIRVVSSHLPIGPRWSVMGSSHSPFSNSATTKTSPQHWGGSDNCPSVTFVPAGLTGRN